MGVSGAGKSTIGRQLAKVLGMPFYDGDDFHPQANIDKMSKGVPLEDTDRLPWLKSIHTHVRKQLNSSDCVVACSALKQHYRDILDQNLGDNCSWIFLKGDYALVSKRLLERENHFMPADLLQTQFDTLEIPSNAFEVDIEKSPKEIVEEILNKLQSKTEFGILGLGVMGKSLARNLGRNGFRISMYNREVAAKEEQVARKIKDAHQELENALAFSDLSKFVSSIQTPRKILLMVNAGGAVDSVIESLLPHLSPGDVLIDGGNSHYQKTNERVQKLRESNIHFIGIGVSGGEDGALKGPSIMPGGNKEAYKAVAPFFNAIAAKDDAGNPCSDFIGPAGSGHFVKMIHNGIEYVEMQLLAEVYGILLKQGQDQEQIADVFETWKASTDSYLLEISIDILRKQESGSWLLPIILDKAGNKGTGNWATIASAQLGVPSTLIAAALFSRYTSFFKEERVSLSAVFSKPEDVPQPECSTQELQNAFQFARIINHYQGFKVLSVASEKFGWDLNLRSIARVWTNGCIIRSDLMKELVPKLSQSKNLLEDKELIGQLKLLRPNAAKVISQCALNGIAVPCLSESLNFFFSVTTANSNANLIQAQRDYFGAHSYLRTDDPNEQPHHTIWKT